MIDGFIIQPIGIIRSPLSNLDDAPHQGAEASIEGELVVDERFADALFGLKPGQKILILYWLHQAERDRMQVHPRGDRSRPLKGVFATRSPHRPNPIAIEALEVIEIQGTRLKVRGLDALDGTPLIDIKIAL